MESKWKTNLWLLSLSCLALPAATGVQSSPVIQDHAGGIFYSEYTNTHNTSNISQVNLIAATARFKSAQVWDLHIHHNTSPDVQALAFESTVVDQDGCIQHLEDLNSRLRSILTQKYNADDLNLYRLLDTYGRVSPPGKLQGNTFSPGRYEDCLKLTLRTHRDGSLNTRFCWALIRHSDWPADDLEAGSYVAQKVGICLPGSCDSSEYGQKFNLIENLMGFHDRDVDRGAMVLAELYCLPDEDSSLRSGWWFRSPGTIITVVAFLGWFVYVIYSTIQFRRLENRTMKRVAFTSDYLHYKSLSLTENFKKLIDPSSRNKAGKSVIDLEVIDGMKVLVLLPIIGASHSIIFSSAIWNNTKDLGQIKSPLWVMTHVNAGFIVSGFMVISGILNGYTLFKKHLSKPIIEDPLKWLDLIVHRYLRLAIVFVASVAFVKYIGKHMNSGPFWDYGTSAASPRALCLRESWLQTIFLMGNFYNPITQCIPIGWYLAADFQFFLLTPIFIYYINLDKTIGRKLIIGCIVFTFIFTVLEAFLLSSSGDPLSVANFRPDALFYSFTYLMPVYTLPWHRIGSYLIGLLLGHLLFCHERRVIENQSTQIKNIELPFKMDIWAGKLCIVLVFAHLFGPYVARLIPFTYDRARIGVALYLPFSYLVVSLLVGLYIVLAATRRGVSQLDRLLAAPLWRPFARLTLCVTITQFEWLNQSNQASTTTEQFKDLYMMRLFISNQIFAYAIAIAVYLLIEEPGRKLFESYWSRLYRLINKFEILPKIVVKCT